MKYKWFNIIGLSCGLVGTIGFGTMWGISANQTYQLKDGMVKGIGINNFNRSWNQKGVLQLNTSPDPSYQAFITKTNTSETNQPLVKAINTNYHLWISGIVLTVISMLLIASLIVIYLWKNLKRSTPQK